MVDMADKKQVEKVETEKFSLPRQPVEAWREALATPAWLFAAAVAKNRWPVGFELSEDDYKRAIRATEQEVIR